ncbi:hypoxia-inducible factor 1-alpha inhibitor [Plakobranchus ocellatus]|uniref:Hypoxia-inducible factor 1-alpha inhibitor n=1 Tax=Plakobranchus ocellatus TaxID=259542 RepID=A0AAV4D260_9GAST|nr:hypoxia-inducible factor 1-alpha inhibitor [Plakobranchus ocellatus]
MRRYQEKATIIPKRLETSQSQQPVIITGSDLVGSAYHWNLDYLCAHLGYGLYTVYSSTSGKFKYYDEKKVPNVPSFKPPTSHTDMTFQDFVSILRQKNDSKWIYLQQPLNDTVGPRIEMDFKGFNWDFAYRQMKKNRWGPLTSNLLLVGMEGVITPAHYDEQENLFAQIQGYKRFLLFHPDQFECLYPYPIFHPHDRQSQVDFDEPDLKKFPLFSKLKGYEGIVGPKDVLYIPMYWWHQVESLQGHGETISCTFWFKAAPTEKVVYPLNAGQKVAIMRNIEKMIADTLKDNKNMPHFMKTMVQGSADRPPTALPSFRPPCDWRFFGTISIAAMLWPVAVSEEEFAEVSHGTKLSCFIVLCYEN